MTWLHILGLLMAKYVSAFASSPAYLAVANTVRTDHYYPAYTYSSKLENAANAFFTGKGSVSLEGAVAGAGYSYETTTPTGNKFNYLFEASATGTADFNSVVITILSAAINSEILARDVYKDVGCSNTGSGSIKLWGCIFGKPLPPPKTREELAKDNYLSLMNTTLYEHQYPTVAYNEKLETMAINYVSLMASNGCIRGCYEPLYQTIEDRANSVGYLFATKSPNGRNFNYIYERADVGTKDFNSVLVSILNAVIFAETKAYGIYDFFRDVGCAYKEGNSKVYWCCVFGKQNA